MTGVSVIHEENNFRLVRPPHGLGRFFKRLYAHGHIIRVEFFHNLFQVELGMPILGTMVDTGRIFSDSSTERIEVF